MISVTACRDAAEGAAARPVEHAVAEGVLAHDAVGVDGEDDGPARAAPEEDAGEGEAPDVVDDVLGKVAEEARQEVRHASGSCGRILSSSPNKIIPFT